MKWKKNRAKLPSIEHFEISKNSKKKLVVFESLVYFQSAIIIIIHQRKQKLDEMVSAYCDKICAWIKCEFVCVCDII